MKIATAIPDSGMAVAVGKQSQAKMLFKKTALSKESAEEKGVQEGLWPAHRHGHWLQSRMAGGPVQAGYQGSDQRNSSENEQRHTIESLKSDQKTTTQVNFLLANDTVKQLL